MAKQKYELLPDKVVAANAETIKAIGHIATDTDIVDYVSGQLMRDYIKFGKKTLDEAAKLTEQTIMSDDFLDKLGAIKNMTNWYYSGRQVYLFDDDFADLLSGQGTADLKISADVFKQLPCNCFYVQRKYKNSVGFFFDLQGDRMTMTEYFFDDSKKDYYSESIAIELQYDISVEDLIYKILGSYAKKDKAGTKAMICDIAEKLQFHRLFIGCKRRNRTSHETPGAEENRHTTSTEAVCTATEISHSQCRIPHWHCRAQA